MVTKMADKIGLKKRNCHFRPNFRLLETDFSTIRYQLGKYQKKTFNILCVVKISESTVSEKSTSLGKNNCKMVVLYRRFSYSQHFSEVMIIIKLLRYKAVTFLSNLSLAQSRRRLLKVVYDHGTS